MVTEDEMVGWHHQLNGHEFKQTLGQESLECCRPCDRKEWDTAEQLSNNNNRQQIVFLRLLYCVINF